MQAVVLAGGIGSRIQSLSQGRPKALIPVLGKEFLGYQIDWLIQQGTTSLLISIGFEGEQIRNFVKDKGPWKIPIQFVDEGANLLGTGGALRLAWDKNLLEKDFVLLYGDSFLQLNLSETIKTYRNLARPALMVVYKNDGRFDKSNVKFSQGKVELYDKFYKKLPQKEFDYIDYGLSILSSNLISEKIPSQQKYDLAQFYHELSLEGRLSGFEASERFYEIGSIEGLNDFQNYLMGQNAN